MCSVSYSVVVSVCSERTVSWPDFCASPLLFFFAFPVVLVSVHCFISCLPRYLHDLNASFCTLSCNVSF